MTQNPFNEDIWKKEFDDRFTNLGEEDDGLTIMTLEEVNTKLKPFISNLLSSYRTAIKKEIEGRMYKIPTIEEHPVYGYIEPSTATEALINEQSYETKVFTPR